MLYFLSAWRNLREKYKMNLVSVPLEGLDSTPQTKGHASELEQSKRCNYSHLGNVCWLQGDVTVCSHEVYPER